MKFTLRWLKQFIDFSDAGVDSIVNALTNLGMEVTNVVPACNLESFIVGEVVECSKHLSADNLSVCKVSIGGPPLNIVCGGKNVRTGLKIVFSPIGSVIPINGMVIKKAKIRGEESEGMICSGFELGFDSDHDNIIELEPNTIVGKRFIDVCPWAADSVIELAITQIVLICLEFMALLEIWLRMVLAS